MYRWGLAAFSILLAACASAPVEQVVPPPSGSVMFLPPVAEVTLVTAAGLREPREDWSTSAGINLAEALSAEVSTTGYDWIIVKGEASDGLVQDMSTGALSDDRPAIPADFTHLPDRPDLVALIVVHTDVESSASRLVQTGLGIMFGGMPGPDGIDRSAHLYLFDRKSGLQVWSYQADGKDAREPDAAAALIGSLLAPLETAHSH